MRLNPIVMPVKRAASAKRIGWLRARQVRSELHPHMDQKEVARALGCSRQAVEQCELRALSKIVQAFDLLK